MSSCVDLSTLIMPICRFTARARVRTHIVMQMAVALEDLPRRVHFDEGNEGFSISAFPSGSGISDL